MIVAALLQPCYNLLHATLLHSGWWPLVCTVEVTVESMAPALGQSDCDQAS